MKKFLIFLVTLLVVVAGANAASLRQMQLEIVDEFWQPITDITQISVFDAGTSSATSIFSDRAGSQSMTNPITTGSSNSTFDQAAGFVRWYQRAPDYKVTITNGTKTLTTDNRNATFIRFPWHLNYIGTAASLSVNDNQSISVGTDLDMVLSWVNASDLMNWIPLSDGSAFNLGSTTVTKQVDFNVFVGGIGGGGLAIDEGNATLIWTGGATTISGGTISLNASSNNITNINTGSSTAAVNIGSSAAGNITLDTTAAMVINADDSVAVTTSAGTIGVTSIGGDITIDATDKSVIIRGTEEVGDAVVIHADGTAGGIDITSGTGDIVMVSTDDISMTVNTTTTDNIIITNTPGNDENAIDIDAKAGGIDIDFATAKNMAITGGQFIFTSNENVASAFSVITNTGTSESITLVNTQGEGTGAITLTTTAAGDIDVNSGDDMTVDVTDDYTVTVGGDYTLAVTGATILPNDVLLKTTTALTHDHMDNLAATPKELVTAVPGNTIEFVSAIFALDWDSVAWTEPSAPDDLVIRYTNTTGAIVSHLLDATGFATVTEDTVAFLGSNVSDAAGADVASVAVTEANSTNKGLFLHNTGSEWTASGDSQVVVITYYRLHTTAELGL